MRDSLRTQLTVTLLALTILPLLLSGLVAAQQTFQAQEQQVLALEGARAQQVTTAVESFLNGVEGQLHLALEVKGLVGQSTGEQQELLSELLAYQDAFADLALLNRDGRELVHVSRLRTYRSQDLGSRAGAPEYRVPSRTGQVYYSPVRFDQVLGEPIITISLPVLDPASGELRGVLVGDARLKRIWDVLAGMALGEGESVYIVSEEGRLIAHRNPSVVLRGTRFEVPARDGIYPGLDSPQVVLAFETIQFGEQSLRVVAERSTTEAFRLARNTLLITAVAVLGGIVLAAGAGLAAVRRIVRPIESLSSTVELVAAGDFSRRVPLAVARYRRGSGTREDEIGRLATTFNRMAAQLQDMVAGLETRVAERTRDLERRSNYLQASAEVGRAAASILEVDRLTGQVVNLIRERFDLYYVGLFLVNEGGRGAWAVLRAGTGKAGQALISRGHRIRVGEGMIGWAVSRGQARVSGEAARDVVRLATPELPETRSEAALPLRSRGQVIGALTVQHVMSGAFDPETVAVLQLMADQVAVAIDNARLFAESQAALAAERRAYGEVSAKAWQRLSAAREQWGYRSSEEGLAPATGQWPREMQQALG
ncbi:MAG: HAMP domain-containing protein, partial [Chloroflexi bacterium]